MEVVNEAMPASGERITAMMRLHGTAGLAGQLHIETVTPPGFSG